MEITGIVIAVLPVESGVGKTSGKEWKKQDFVLQTEEKYPKKVCLQLFGDKVDDCPAVDEAVKVSFDIDSREYKGRWYTQLNAWKVETIGTVQTAYTQQAAQAQPTPSQAQGDADLLPF